MKTFAALALIALTGCAGSAMTSAAPRSDDSASETIEPMMVRSAATLAATKSVAGIEAIGGAVTALYDESASERPAKTAKAAGACRHGIEFYAPDRAGDPNSTETEFFYSPSCSQIARDSVRVYTRNGSTAESVKLTVSNYAAGLAAPISTRTSSVQISNAAFSGYGWPVVSAGFVREAQSRLVVGSATIDADHEFVLSPASGDVSAFCSDWAGYNITGVARLNATFGWTGGFLSGGTRTVNSDGSVTWSGSRSATLYQAPIGGLSVVEATPNSACPISAPAYAISGGTAKGSSIGTLTVTFDNGLMRSLSIERTSLADGYSFVASSHAGVWPTSVNFITGTVTRKGKNVAAFAVNAVGDGTLTIAATDTVYRVAGWAVVR